MTSGNYVLLIAIALIFVFTIVASAISFFLQRKKLDAIYEDNLRLRMRESTFDQEISELERIAESLESMTAVKPQETIYKD